MLAVCKALWLFDNQLNTKHFHDGFILYKYNDGMSMDIDIYSILYLFSFIIIYLILPYLFVFCLLFFCHIINANKIAYQFLI